MLMLLVIQRRVASLTYYGLFFFLAGVVMEADDDIDFLAIIVTVIIIKEPSPIFWPKQPSHTEDGVTQQLDTGEARDVWLDGCHCPWTWESGVRGWNSERKNIDTSVWWGYKVDRGCVRTMVVNLVVGDMVVLIIILVFFIHFDHYVYSSFLSKTSIKLRWVSMSL
jgi:hypothetical protein